MRRSDNIHVSTGFSVVTTRTIDERKRLCIGDLLKGFNRVQLCRNAAGELLIRPVVEVPASEAWLFKNKRALASVQKGLKDAALGKISRLDPRSLEEKE